DAFDAWPSCSGADSGAGSAWEGSACEGASSLGPCAGATCALPAAPHTRIAKAAAQGPDLLRVRSMCTTLLHARLAFVPTKDRVTCLLVHTQFRPILGVLVGSLVALSASALAEAPAHKRPTPALLAKAA